jgi:hypothetical protein
MRHLILTCLVALALVTVAVAAPVDGTFQDNADNETGFDMFRATIAAPAACLPDPGPNTISAACKTAVTTACQAVPAASFAKVKSIPANAPAQPSIVPWSDAPPEGSAHCYEWRATNGAGVSGFSNIAGKYVAFTVPAPPSSNTIP